MAVDFGLKRTGLAVTDPLQIIAQGLDTVDSPGALAFIREYVSREPVEQIVVGYPFIDDAWGDAVFKHELDAFIERLRKAFPDLKIVLQDERHTSVAAKEVIIRSGRKKSSRREKGLLDRTSAILILQEYLGHI